jgi:hypothetical protein
MPSGTVKLNQVPSSHSANVRASRHHGGALVADAHLVVTQKQTTLGLVLLFNLLDNQVLTYWFHCLSLFF